MKNTGFVCVLKSSYFLQKDTATEVSNSCQFPEISRILGDYWKTMSTEMKARYLHLEENDRARRAS